jgi:formylglycine-generating enzyme required for sulfatase activity
VYHLNIYATILLLCCLVIFAVLSVSFLADGTRLSASAEEPKHTFRECSVCPEMVVVPAGDFMMGAPADEKNHRKIEGPQHKVTIATAFAVAKFEVTFDEWDTCFAHHGCKIRPQDQGLGRGLQAVTSVSWSDVQDYLGWLSKNTGKPYRLLSEAEWEYAARAGSKTAYPWGDEFSAVHANCNSCGSQWNKLPASAAVGMFPANAFGLHDMHGNVWEWVQDCVTWYSQTPTDGSAWTSNNCTDRVVRGGSWYRGPRSIRSASRYWTPPDTRGFDLGFRIARTLP